MNNFHVWPSPAKLNLFLYITGQRPDGYHQLQTLFQFLDVGDTLSIRTNTNSTISISPALSGVATEQNLIYKAAIALRNFAHNNNQAHKNHLPTNLGADIHVDKCLPMGGGLGGGSSNAATTLVALNAMWGYDLSIEQLAEIGLSLGADVPVFVKGHSAFAEGIGEQLSPANPDENWYVVLKPDVDIATQHIFTHPDLTRNTPYRSLNELLVTPYANDCQKIVTLLYPEVADQLSWLLQYAPSRLTGTGACVFAELDSQIQAQSLLERWQNDRKERHNLDKLERIIKNELDKPYFAHSSILYANDDKNSVLGFVAKGVNISPLHKTLTDYNQLVNNP